MTRPRIIIAGCSRRLRSHEASENSERHQPLIEKPLPQTSRFFLAAEAVTDRAGSAQAFPIAFGTIAHTWRTALVRAVRAFSHSFGLFLSNGAVALPAV